MNGLRRELGLRDATLLIVGTIIGAGVFVVPNVIARSAEQPFWMMAAWALAGAMTMLGALAFAELGAMFPDSGGQYVYLREAYGPGLAFLNGWTSLTIVFSGALAWMGTAFALYLRQFVPLNDWQVKAVALGLIGVLTLVNCWGTRVGVRVQNILAALKLLGIVTVIVSAFLVPAAPATLGAVKPWSAAGFGAALVVCLLSYEGWIAVGLVAGEVKNPQRVIPRAIGLGVFIVIAVYLTTNLSYLHVMTPAQIAASDRVAADAVSRAFGPQGANFVAALVLLSLCGAANGWAFTTPRIYYAMAKDGLFFRTFAAVNPEHGTPVHAILLQAIAAAVMVLSGTLEILGTFVMFTTWLFYGLTVAGLLLLRKRRPDAQRPYRMWGYPWTLGVFVAFAAAFVGVTLVTQPRTSLAALAIILAGLPAYWIWRRQQHG